MSDLYDDNDRAYDMYVEDCLLYGLDWRDYPNSYWRIRDLDYYNSDFQDEIEEMEEVES